MDQPAVNPRRKWIALFLLMFLLFALYLSNLRVIVCADTIPNKLLPLNIVAFRSLYLDTWGPAYLTKGYHNGPYFFTESRGHLMSAYPIIMPVALSPLYVLPYWWLLHQPKVLWPMATTLIIDTMEKVSAALIAALSAGILFLALLKVADFQCSLLVSAIYGAASETWAISGQGLWRQGFAELSFALLLWALLRGSNARMYGFCVGVALAMAAANTALYGVVAVALLLAFALHQRKQFAMCLAPLALIGGLVLFYNTYFFDHMSGAYFVNLATKGPWQKTHDTSHPIWQGIVWQLISPSRGLLIYMPWTLFALWGGVRLWKENAFFWARYLLISLLLVYLVRADFSGWWGGWVYGPRYLTDLLPFLAFLLIPIWSVLRSSALMRAAMGITVAMALGIQTLGAFQYITGVWDALPKSVDEQQARLWDWKDTQIARCWEGGMFDTEFDKRWTYYFQVKAELARRGLIPAKGSSQAPQ